MTIQNEESYGIKKLLNDDLKMEYNTMIENIRKLGYGKNNNKKEWLFNLMNRNYSNFDEPQRVSKLYSDYNLFTTNYLQEPFTFLKYKYTNT